MRPFNAREVSRECDGIIEMDGNTTSKWNSRASASGQPEIGIEPEFCSRQRGVKWVRAQTAGVDSGYWKIGASNNFLEKMRIQNVC